MYSFYSNKDGGGKEPIDKRLDPVYCVVPNIFTDYRRLAQTL